LFLFLNPSIILRREIGAGTPLPFASILSLLFPLIGNPRKEEKPGRLIVETEGRAGVERKRFEIIGETERKKKRARECVLVCARRTNRRSSNRRRLHFW